MLALFWPLGQCSASLLAMMIIPSFGWRWFAAISVLPSCMTVFMRPFICESPRWLLTRGRRQEATEACFAIAEANGKTRNEVGLHAGVLVASINEHTSLAPADP